MSEARRRKTSLTLDAAALEDARDLGINVSAVAERALKQEVIEARRRKWLEENKDAFAAQADWHAQNGHPLADIITPAAGSSWKS